MHEVKDSSNQSTLHLCTTHLITFMISSSLFLLSLGNPHEFLVWCVQFIPYLKILGIKTQLCVNRPSARDTLTDKVMLIELEKKICSKTFRFNFTLFLIFYFRIFYNIIFSIVLSSLLICVCLNLYYDLFVRF